MIYLFELYDSDCNDCTVNDVLVQANNEEEAKEKICRYVEDTDPELEADGGYGWYYPCKHDDTEDWCEGHGGVVLNEEAIEVWGDEVLEEVVEKSCKDYHILLDLREY